MTVHRTPVQLFVERAPTDPFDDDSTPRYRVVAALGQGAARRHVVPLTRAHDTEAEAMAVLSDKILRGALTSVLNFTAQLTADELVKVRAELGEPYGIGPNPLKLADEHDEQPAERKWWRR